LDKPIWLRLGLSFLFVLAAFGGTSLFWLFVDRPISAPLFLVAIVASAWLCGFRVGVFATVLAGFVIDFFFVAPLYQFSIEWNDIARFVIFLAEGVIISWIIELRRIAADEMSRSHAQLQALSEREQTVREAEQKRIALEIHDELGQAMTGLKMEVHFLKGQTANSEDPQAQAVTEKLAEISSAIDTTVSTIRRIATELRPSIIDDFGLVAAMEWHARKVERSARIRCSFRSDTEHLNLDPKTRIAVFRIFQEAVTNILRHSHARSFTVAIDSSEDPIVLSIRDDGVGLGAEQPSVNGSLGIIGMKERARSFHGELLISSGPGGGTAVELRIPSSLRTSAEVK
jgi:signal transduction histidine kinase